MFMSVALFPLMARHLHCEYLSLLTFYGIVEDYLKTNQDIWTGKKFKFKLSEKVEMLHASSNSLLTTFATNQNSVMMSLRGII